jgi:hypothetical protein
MVSAILLLQHFGFYLLLVVEMLLDDLGMSRLISCGHLFTELLQLFALVFCLNGMCEILVVLILEFSVLCLLALRVKLVLSSLQLGKFSPVVSKLHIFILLKTNCFK